MDTPELGRHLIALKDSRMHKQNINTSVDQKKASQFRGILKRPSSGVFTVLFYIVSAPNHDEKRRGPGKNDTSFKYFYNIKHYIYKRYHANEE
jgi:hypothetical protein